jgi:hypothetical protein
MREVAQVTEQEGLGTMKNVETATTEKSAAPAAQGAHVAPEKASSKKAATRKKGAPNARKTAKGRKSKIAAPKKAGKAGNRAVKPTSAKKASAPRAESKGAKIIEMIGRTNGATLAEIMKAVQWQAHSVRGFISTAAKKHGIKIDFAKNEAGNRFYRLCGAPHNV